VTDAQIAALIAAITAGLSLIAAAVKFVGGRIVKSNDASTAALIANTASNAVLMVKIDQLVSSNTELARKLDAIGDFMEEHTPIGPVPRPRKLPTPPKGSPTPGGRYHVRGASRADEE
jgi:hypothetical protein